MHEVIEDMVAQNVRTATFEWEIAQVDENGNYTLDENGKRLLMASAAALALGLVIAMAYRKKV